MGKGARRGLIGPTLAAFGVVVLLVCAIFAFLLHAVRDMQHVSQRAAGSERAVVLTSRLNRLVIDLETGVRGRLLTGDERFLEPYRAAQAAIPDTQAALRALIDDPAQQRRLAVLERDVDAYRSQYAAPLSSLAVEVSPAEL